MPDKIFYFDPCMCEESNAVDGGIWLYSSKILGNSNLDSHLWKRDILPSEKHAGVRRR